MKAIVYEEYGPPEVLKLRDVAKPTPGDGQILVKVLAASVNALDWHYMRGTPRMMRLIAGLSKPKLKILGADMAGVVEGIGKGVTQFKPGDEVFGNPKTFGAFAEYVLASEEDIALKPANLTFEEAAAIPLAALTALQAVRDNAKVQQRQRVLINGAAGGVGTFAVQIAKSYGAIVTAVCSSRNVDMVKSIGADHVVDYAQTDFVQVEGGFDQIIDNVGNRSVSDYGRALVPGGRCTIVGFTSTSLLFEHMTWAPLYSMKSGKKIGMMPTAAPNKKDLLTLKELVEAGKIKPIIDKQYSLSETPEAVRYVETGHARAKVVVRI